MKELAQYKEKIVTKITEQLTNIRLPKFSTSKDLKEKLLPYTKGGKFMRGSLIIAVHDLYEGHLPSQAVEAAASLELTQSMLIIVDDIIDKDTIRRSNPTMHKQYESEVKDKHYGEGLANCLAIIAQFQATSLLQHQPQEIIDLISYEMTCCGLAEMEEITFTINQEATIEQVLEMYKYKTGHYTFNLPIAIGAILADVEPSEQHRLWNLSTNLGLIFQIQDDLLELTSTPQELGKSKSDDDNNTLTIPKLIGEDKAREMVDECINQAKEIIPQLKHPEFFSKLLEYLINRKK